MGRRRSHREQAFLTFILTVLSACFLLPLVRTWPESVHTYFNGLAAWIRYSFIFMLCVIFTASVFKLLTPKIGQLSYLYRYPPAWIAAVVAWIVVAIIDTSIGFGDRAYRAAWYEWACYGIGSLLVVSWHSGFLKEIWALTGLGWNLRDMIPDLLKNLGTCVSYRLLHFERKIRNRIRSLRNIDDSLGHEEISLKIANADWDKIERWLESDEPASFDFLENKAIADRVFELIEKGTRSIGLAGPFGAGKTSIARKCYALFFRHTLDLRHEGS